MNYLQIEINVNLHFLYCFIIIIHNKIRIVDTLDYTDFIVVTCQTLMPRQPPSNKQTGCCHLHENYKVYNFILRIQSLSEINWLKKILRCPAYLLNAICSGNRTVATIAPI